jgi:hypothetical protein
MMRLNAKAMALSAAILWGASVFLATAWILVTGGAGETLAKLGAFYLGYTVSWPGAFIGLVYGFIDGLIGGFLLVWLYNMFLPKGTAQ